jgi:hypothetical protein
MLVSRAHAAATDGYGDYSGIHTIAVISALGDDILMVSSGEMGFGKAQYILHTDWKIDTDIRQHISEALSPRFKVVVPSMDTAPFNNVSATAFDTIWDVLQKRVQSLPKLEGVDAYLIVFPRERSLRRESWRGVQVTHSTSWVAKEATIITTYYQIAVLRASDGKGIGGGEAEYPASGYISGYSPPAVSCSNDLWADNAADLSQQQMEKIRQEASVLIAKGLMGALTSTKLIGQDEAALYTQSHPTPPDISECHPF